MLAWTLHRGSLPFRDRAKSCSSESIFSSEKCSSECEHRENQIVLNCHAVTVFEKSFVVTIKVINAKLTGTKLRQNLRSFFLYDEHRDIHIVELPELYGRYEKMQVDHLFAFPFHASILYSAYCYSKVLFSYVKKIH